MATWYYKGRTPAPVEIPGRGSVVLVRGTTFEAPEGSVAILARAGLVTRLADRVQAPKPAEKPIEAARVEPAPKSAAPQEAPPAPTAKEEEAEIGSDGDSGLGLDVVGSAESSSAPPVAAEAEAAEAGSEGLLAPPVKKKKQRSAHGRNTSDPEQT